MADFEILFPNPITGDKRPAVWRDKAGVMHRAVGARQISWDRDTFIMWTACGKKDIPGGRSWLQNPGDDVTCGDCQQAERVSEEDATEARRAHAAIAKATAAHDRTVALIQERSHAV